MAPDPTVLAVFAHHAVFARLAHPFEHGAKTRTHFGAIVRMDEITIGPSHELRGLIARDRSNGRTDEGEYSFAIDGENYVVDVLDELPIFLPDCRISASPRLRLVISVATTRTDDCASPFAIGEQRAR